MAFFHYLILGVLFTSTSFADIIVDATHLFVPSGYDSDDEAVVVIDGELPSTCYVLGEVSVNQSKLGTGDTLLRIEQEGVESCSTPLLEDSTVPFSRSVSLGSLNAGTYLVAVSGVDEQIALEIGEAEEIETQTAVLASVTGIDLNLESPSKKFMTVSGLITNSCFAIAPSDITLTVEGNILKVQTKLQKLPVSPDGSPCTAQRSEFAIERPLPALGAGRFLVFVPMMDGQYLTRIFDSKL